MYSASQGIFCRSEKRKFIVKYRYMTVSIDITTIYIVINTRVRQSWIAIRDSLQFGAPGNTNLRDSLREWFDQNRVTLETDSNTRSVQLSGVYGDSQGIFFILAGMRIYREISLHVCIDIKTVYTVIQYSCDSAESYLMIQTCESLYFGASGDFGALRNEFTAKKLFELHTNDLHCHVLRNANLSQNLSI